MRASCSAALVAPPASACETRSEAATRSNEADCEESPWSTLGGAALAAMSPSSSVGSLLLRHTQACEHEREHALHFGCALGMREPRGERADQDQLRRKQSASETLTLGDEKLRQPRGRWKNGAEQDREWYAQSMRPERLGSGAGRVEDCLHNPSTLTQSAACIRLSLNCSCL